VIDCSFWNSTKQRINPLQQQSPLIHFFREQHNAGHTIRLDRIKDFGKSKVSSKIAQRIQTYGQNNYEVYAAFLAEMEQLKGQKFNWVVDASKDPYRLLWLARSGLFNIKLLHVVKNPRAFAYSMIKRLPKNEINLFHKRFYETLRQSLKWSIENHLIYQVAQNHLNPSDYLLVNYERLALNPLETFQAVCSIVGCKFESQAVENFREGSLHTIAGNPMRYQSGGILLDEKWKSLLPDFNRIVAEIATSINRGQYGYK
jgi:Sulfotransferase domain